MPDKGANTWVVLTRSTRDPKLRWLADKMSVLGVKIRRVESTNGTAQLHVCEDQLREAWAVLNRVDDLPDDDPLFSGVS